MKKYAVLGLMSGTSLDGLDMAYCQFWKQEGRWNFEIRKAKTVSYPDWMFNFLKDAVNLSSQAHQTLHEAFGTWSGSEAKQFILEKSLEIDFIASHGHTSHHKPHMGITFQLGDGQFLANAAGQRVICDFRTQDVQKGGQGAPLVPIGDELLLSEYDFCLNLGGISNISFRKDGERLAYDVGMANMPLNFITQKMGLKYDENGALARSGQLNAKLLAELNALKYYALPFPKSTGIEWLQQEVLPILEKFKIPNEDKLHTLIHHNCEQIQNAITAQNPKKDAKLIVTGGGALNSFFVEVLTEKLKGLTQVVTPPKKFIEYKEAMVFGFMGLLRELNQINILKSVTGAKENSCSGEIFLPN